MNVQEYIASGILEDYVTGAASDQERQEVECMSHIYPEIQEELEMLQLTLEHLAVDHAVSPTPEVRAQVLAVLDDLSDESEETPVDDTPVIPLEPQQPKSGGLRKYGMAAAVFIAVASVIMLFKFKNQADTLAAEQEKLKQENLQQIEETAKALASKAQLERNIALMTDPANSVVAMTELEGKPDALATIYWNKETQEVYLSVDHMFVPDDELQYQLWAIKDGQAVDCGVFEANVDSLEMQKMYNIDRAEAFVVTLEKRGGVPVAEGEAYIIGNI